ncbi:hypothetical protein CONLIGDRAFT_628388 [Coniochaeta ligniaria NRRL 30616]|uniref:Uncharacterized protein n=1 Tax=Coniochaeta ligniaria NRRL 30616 TaxID=1408157 RepID=A0A1J7JJC9_9PEZI|nr:hypothetical protein CONLIGDRAFT_628388 [Coniochaeta ligniaria NRRL 30616]
MMKSPNQGTSWIPESMYFSTPATATWYALGHSATVATNHTAVPYPGKLLGFCCQSRTFTLKLQVVLCSHDR